MKREEAIEILSRPFYMAKVPRDILEAHKMAVDALEKEPCDDCVSRQAVLEWIKGSLEQYADTYSNDMLNMWMLFEEQIKAMSPITSIQPKVKVGHWIPTYGNVKCSVCGNVKDSRNVGKATHYCDFCGAKMEVEDAD